MQYAIEFDTKGFAQTIFALDGYPVSLRDGKIYKDKEELHGYYVVSEEEWALYSSGEYVCGVHGKPVKVVPSVEEIIDSTWNVIKSDRDAAERSGCPYMGSVLDSDQTSVQRISIAVQAAQGALAAGTKGFVLDWTMQDNTIIAMTAEQVIGMSAALAAYSNELHERARVLRDQIEQIAADYKAGTLPEEDARAALAAIKFGG